MIQIFTRLCSILVAVSLLFLPGCGGQKLPEGMPKPTPTTLTILQDGAPLEGALVSLFPMEAGSRWDGGGVTDSNGKAKMKTLGQYDGVVPGNYKVTVKKTFVPKPPEGLSSSEVREWLATAPPPTELVHKQFGTKETTPLDLKVDSSPVEETFEVEKP